MKIRYIFDLDGTLLLSKYKAEDVFFENVLSREDALRFNEMRIGLIHEYERIYSKYDIKSFSQFLSMRSGVSITESMVLDLVNLGKNFDDKLVDGTISTLEYLKQKNKELVVLSNWFKKTQVDRLKRFGLDSYFDEVYGGDTGFKPSSDSFYLAMGRRPVEECVMIGDNYEVDIIGARNVGLDAVYISDNDDIVDKNKIKNLSMLKEMF